MYPRLLDLGVFTIYTYGVLLAAAYLGGLQLAVVRAKARGLDATRILDLGIYIIIAALLGAKLLLLVTDFQAFRANPRELLDLLREGGVFYGGLILAVSVALAGDAFLVVHPHRLGGAGGVGLELLLHLCHSLFTARVFSVRILARAAKFFFEFLLELAQVGGRGGGGA